MTLGLDGGAFVAVKRVDRQVVALLKAERPTSRSSDDLRDLAATAGVHIELIQA